MFKNKHIVTALIVAPILAIGAYFATDYLVTERPQPAAAGGQYPLLALPNCRYQSGQCGLKNGNFKVLVSGDSDDGGNLLLRLDSEFSLDEVRVAVVRDTSDTGGPVLMQQADDKAEAWQVNLQVIAPSEQFLRLVITVDGAVYYAETGLQFLQYRTSFNKDFRSR